MIETTTLFNCVGLIIIFLFVVNIFAPQCYQILNMWLPDTLVGSSLLIGERNESSQESSLEKFVLLCLSVMSSPIKYYMHMNRTPTLIGLHRQ